MPNSSASRFVGCLSLSEFIGTAPPQGNPTVYRDRDGRFFRCWFDHPAGIYREAEMSRDEFQRWAIEHGHDAYAPDCLAAMLGTPATGSSDSNGPQPGNRFAFNGKVHDISPILWRLLNAMWGHESRDRLDVADEVWPGDSEPGDAGKSALRDVKAFLEQIGYPRFVAKPRNSDTLVWKEF